MVSIASVLLIESFYGGSHKQLVDQLCAEIPNCHLVTLPAKKWHWKARTAALYLSQNIPAGASYRVLFTSSVLNLAELIALRPDLGRLKKVLYFHENQLVYPVRKQQDRDFQYGYNQVISSLVADVVVFNSKFNKDSFLSSINTYMKLIPDHRPRGLADIIRPKCRVLYFPIKFPPKRDPLKPTNGEIMTNKPSTDCVSSEEVITHTCISQSDLTKNVSMTPRCHVLGQDVDSESSEAACVLAHNLHNNLDENKSTRSEMGKEGSVALESRQSQSVSHGKDFKIGSTGITTSGLPNLAVSTTGERKHKFMDKSTNSVRMTVMYHVDKDGMRTKGSDTQDYSGSHDHHSNVQHESDQSHLNDDQSHPNDDQFHPNYDQSHPSNDLSCSSSMVDGQNLSGDNVTGAKLLTDCIKTEMHMSSVQPQLYYDGCKANNSTSCESNNDFPMSHQNVLSTLTSSGQPGKTGTAQEKQRPLHIVWPHRWEHDKDPDMFFRALFQLQDDAVEFRVSVLGEMYSDVPEVFSRAESRLRDHIAHWGYQDNKVDYYNILQQADVVVSTAMHEFFGVAMLEAVHFGCYPLCPNKLVYPEIFPVECLYNTEVQLYKRLRNYCQRPHLVRMQSLQMDVHQYSWESLGPLYNQLLSVS